jgi:hypothetical protein
VGRIYDPFFQMNLTIGDLLGINKGTRVYDPGKRTWYPAGKKYTVKLKRIELPPPAFFEEFHELPMAYWKSGHRWRKAYLKDLHLVSPEGEWTPVDPQVNMGDLGVRSKRHLKCHDCYYWAAGCRLQDANRTMIDLNFENIDDLPYPEIHRLHFRNSLSPVYNPAAYCSKYGENDMAKLYFLNDA